MNPPLARVRLAQVDCGNHFFRADGTRWIKDLRPYGKGNWCKVAPVQADEVAGPVSRVSASELVILAPPDFAPSRDFSETVRGLIYYAKGYLERWGKGAFSPKSTVYFDETFTAIFCSKELLPANYCLSVSTCCLAIDLSGPEVLFPTAGGQWEKLPNDATKEEIRAVVLVTRAAA